MTNDAKKAAYRSGAGTLTELDRRNTDRHQFTASAEVIELTSGARFTTRTSDLGPGGCFIDTVNPLPIGARVRVSICKGKSDFHTLGTVVYSQQGLGMGISFGELEPEQRQALNLWVRELSGPELNLAEAPKFKKAPSASGSDRAALVRLVQTLIGKEILTPAEGAAVLLDPFL
jgi:hypothetical protein